MKQLCFILLFSIFDFAFCACNSIKDKKDGTEKPVNAYSSSNNSKTDTNDEDIEGSSSCLIEDGTYSATVDYDNPETGYSNTYTLDVDVESCQVVQINFPKGGWLDEDHIDAADIDEDGNASVSGENGKTYEVHIDN